MMTFNPDAPSDDAIREWVSVLYQSSSSIREKMAPRIKDATAKAFAAQDPSMLLTPEALAVDLGVRKATIHSVAAGMEKDGLIKRIGSYRHAYAWVAGS